MVNIAVEYALWLLFGKGGIEAGGGCARARLGMGVGKARTVRMRANDAALLVVDVQDGFCHQRAAAQATARKRAAGAQMRRCWATGFLNRTALGVWSER